MNNGRKRISYRPNKASGVVGGIIGGIFVLIGIFFVIPAIGAFGILWTAVAGIIAGLSLGQAFGKRVNGRAVFDSEIYIEDIAPEGGDIETRLKKLQELYDRRVISKDEYEETRRKILEDL